MLFRRPLHEVAAWPAWEVEVLEQFLAREPAPDQRIEVAIAQLSAIWVNANRDPRKQPIPVSLDQFLLWKQDPWEREAEIAAQNAWALAELHKP